MKTKITLSILFLFLAQFTIAQQARFTTQGEIEFEKKVNMFALIKSILNKENEVYYQKIFDEYKSKKPQFKTLKSTLTFANNTTLFSPTKEEISQADPFADLPGVSQINTILTDLNNKTSLVEKVVFEEKFHIKDSVRKITWKITNETREIAGFTCRRANALIMDSVYVVAFYTDKIAVSGGPECFTGLPGMILGVALPHDHITWFATSVKDMSIEKPKLLISAKAKITDTKSFVNFLENKFKTWGKQAKQFLRFYIL